MAITPNGNLLVNHGEGSAINRFTVSNGEIHLRDVSGDLACIAPNDVATYTWTETETTVTFSVVSDGCDGRRFVMLYGPWTRR